MSKAWRSILYALGSLSALCIFIAVMIAVVPQSNDRFLIFSASKIELAINAELEIRSIRLQTNLPQDVIKFSSEDESVFKIVGNKIKPQKIGSGRLEARAQIEGKEYHNSVLVEITSLSVSSGDIDFGVQLYYNGSVYNFADFKQDINLFVAGGDVYEREQARFAGYVNSFYFSMPSGCQILADGDCVEILGDFVTAVSLGSCVVKVYNAEAGKHKAVTVNAASIPLSDVSIDCGNSVALTIGEGFLPKVVFVPVFVSDIYRTYSFDIKNTDIIYFDTGKFIACSQGQTQIDFIFGQIKKTVQVIVVPAASELRAEFLMVDAQGRVTMRINLLCGGEKSAIESNALGVKLFMDGSEEELPQSMCFLKDATASLGYDYVYKLSGEFCDEFIIKIYLLDNPAIFAVLHVVLN